MSVLCIGEVQIKFLELGGPWALLGELSHFFLELYWEESLSSPQLSMAQNEDQTISTFATVPSLSSLTLKDSLGLGKTKIDWIKACSLGVWWLQARRSCPIAFHWLWLGQSQPFRMFAGTDNTEGRKDTNLAWTAHAARIPHLLGVTPDHRASIEDQPWASPEGHWMWPPNRNKSISTLLQQEGCLGQRWWEGGSLEQASVL